MVEMSDTSNNSFDSGTKMSEAVIDTEQNIGDVDEYCPELGEYLTSEYEILRRVLSYMTLNDLRVISRVSKAWESAAVTMRNRRTIIQSFVLSDIKYKMGDIWGEAIFCIAFCTSPNGRMEEEVTEFMPEAGEFVVCLSRTGVIGTTSDNSMLLQQKVRVGLPLAPKKCYLTCVRLPGIVDVGYATFMWQESVGFQEFKNKFKLPENHIVKCLIILMTPEETRLATQQKDDFIAFLKSTQEESFAVGGCVLDDFLGIERGSTNSVVKYIVFFGTNVEAASTVLTPEIKTDIAIDAKIAQLKKKCPDVARGVLFVFRCAGRQRVLRRYRPKHDISKWEGEAIKKYFPNTPICGCFGYGEYGNEFPHDANGVPPNKKLKGSEAWEFSYSTSLVFVGFKK